MKPVDLISFGRVTIIPCINADGEAGPTLYVIKGSGIPYRTLRKDGKAVVKSVADILPRGALVTIRRHNDGVDTTKIFE